MDSMNGATLRYNAIGDVVAAQNIQKTAASKINGDFRSDFKDVLNKAAAPTGIACGTNKAIDKTSALYEKSLELESYIIKIMLSSMRGTLTGTSLYAKDASYAQKMYDDMFYDELAVSVTKNAGFGLADQMYLQLAGK